jgi:hypothetical protein
MMLLLLCLLKFLLSVVILLIPLPWILLLKQLKRSLTHHNLPGHLLMKKFDIDPLSYRHMAATLDTVPVDASSNREDILTQSQMLKSVDRECFIQLQKTKIDGLLKFDVMDIHPMELSPKTSA